MPKADVLHLFALIVASNIFTGIAEAANRDSDPVQAWAACFGPIESAELTWDMDRPTVSLDRKKIEMLRADVFVRARWPDAWDIKVSRMRGQFDAPFTAADPGPERMVFMPNGELLEFADYGTRKTVRRSRIAIDLGTDRSVWFEGGPLLAGKWLHSVGLSQGLAEVRAEKDGSFVVDVPSQRLRATLIPFEAKGCSGLVLSRVDSFRSSGEPDASYEYSDFRVPPTFSSAIGYRRKATVAPRTIPGMEDLPKPPAAREDVLIDARVVPRFSADEFNISTAGFKDFEKKKPTEPDQGDTKSTPTSRVLPSDENGSQIPQNANIGLSFGWLSGVGVGVILAASFMLVRKKLSRE